MISPVLASARALTLRLPRGSFESRLISCCILTHLLGDAGEPVPQRNIVEFGKRLETVGDGEMAVRYRVLARRSANLDCAARKRGDHFRDFTERSGSPRRNIKRPGASVLQHRANERRHILDMHVVALLLA